MKNLSLSLKIMSLFLVAIILQLSMPNYLLAQGQTHFGIKAGIDFANFYGKDAKGDSETPPFENKNGIIFGLFADAPITNIVSLQPGIIYSEKGGKIVEQEEGEKVTSKFNLNYLEIPLLVKTSLPFQKSIIPYLLIGPNLAIKLKSNFQLDINEKKIREKDMDEYTNTIDFGLFFGAGIMLPIGDGKILFECSYNLGLTRMYKEDNGEKLDMKNKVISIMAGYEF